MKMMSQQRMRQTLCINVKLAQRFVCPLYRLRERVGVRETGMAVFIIRRGIFAMPVRLPQELRIGQPGFSFK